jgi:hypothetical protein
MSSGMLFILTYTKIGHLFSVNGDFLFERTLRRKSWSLLKSSCVDSCPKISELYLLKYCIALMPLLESGMETQTRAADQWCSEKVAKKYLINTLIYVL